MATLAEQIAQLESQLLAGATGNTTDGQSTSWDLDQVRRRLRELREQQASDAGDPPRRPAFSRIITAQG